MWDQGVQIRPLAIAPDQDYSIPGHTRILHYRRPTGLFAQLQKQEFIVPTEQISSLATALLQQPEQLPQYAAYQQETENIREMMVCTHGNVDVACARFGFPIYEQLRKELIYKVNLKEAEGLVPLGFEAVITQEKQFLGNP